MIVLIVLEYCDSGSLQDYTRRYRAHMKETKSQPGDQAAGGLSEDAVAYVVREMLSYVHIHHPASTESASLSPGRAPRLNRPLTTHFFLTPYRGIVHIHAKHIMHRDIKGGNIIFHNQAEVGCYTCSGLLRCTGHRLT